MLAYFSLNLSFGYCIRNSFWEFAQLGQCRITVWFIHQSVNPE